MRRRSYQKVRAWVVLTLADAYQRRELGKFVGLFGFARQKEQ